MNLRNWSMTHLNSSHGRHAEGNGNAVDHPADLGFFNRLRCALISTAGIPGKAGAKRARKVLLKLDGVASVHVIFIDSAVKVYFDPNKTEIETMIKAMQAAGFSNRIQKKGNIGWA